MKPNSVLDPGLFRAIFMHRRTPSSYVLVLATVSLLVACGGTQKATDNSGPLELEFSNFDTIALRGVRFEPKALFRQGMLEVTPDKKVPLVKLRKKVRGKHTQVEAQVLASMLWKKDDSDESPTRKEALALLRKEAETKTADVVTLQMLAAGESWSGNNAAWLATNETLLSRFPRHKEVSRWRMWSTWILLRSERLLEAAQKIDGWEFADAGSLGSYVIAWVRFRERRFQEAVQAISFAATNWEGELKGPIKRDVLLMHSRAGTPVPEAEKLLSSLDSVDVPAWLEDLSQGYSLAGYYARAAQALERVFELRPDDKSSGHVASRFMQVEYLFRQNRSKKTAAAATAAHKLLASCEDCTDKQRKSVEERVQRLASFFHSVYQATRDETYFEPAKSLYRYLLDAKLLVAENTTRSSNLEAAKKNGKPADGLHPAETMYQLILARREAVQACYEASLQANTNLKGTFELKLEVSAKGEVIEAVGRMPTKEKKDQKEGSDKEAEGEPEEKNTDDLNAVAVCAADKAKEWKFPGRSRAGKTNVQVSYSLEPRTTQ